jgi:predicted ArsR family transcriptional regulator
MSLNVFELIADPVRLAIVRQLSARPSAPLGEIADHAGVHANTVRSHIGELEAAGVVEREPAVPEGPGRPPLRYRLSPGWRLPSTDLRGLTELLAALVVRLEPALDTVQEFGRQWGRFLAGRPGGDPIAALPRLLEPLGFDTELAGLEVRLRACPCPLVSPDHPELICRLVGAAIDGVVEVGPRRLRVSLTEHDPVRRTCTIHLADRPRRPAVT